jgi:hypothetical protein
MTEFDTYQGASTISRKTLEWKRSKNFYVWIWCCTPELNAISPDGFEYYFVDEEFVGDREIGLAPE